MNILFLTLMEIGDFSQTGIYPDLIHEFADHGHEIYVVSPCEEKSKKRYTLIKEEGNIHLISALIPDYFGVGFVKKGISSLLIEKRYISAIDRSIPNIKFGLILYSTPPITFSGIVEKIKKRDNAITYLLLKDIWPQGPIDIGVLSNSGIKGFITKYYKKKERRLYEISDHIGCMSQKNCEYLIEKGGVEDKKIEICPNAIKIRSYRLIDKKVVRKKNGIPLDKIVFVYGGNLGVAQGVDYIIECLEMNEKNSMEYMLIIGSGTEYKKLEDWFLRRKPNNSKLISYLPKEEYMQVMASADVGLIFLDHRFTIPNFPSRLLSYMEGKMPILASTDNNTDIGQIIQEGGFGYWCESNDAETFVNVMHRFSDEEDRVKMSENAYRYLCNHYTVGKAYDIISKHLKQQ